ncbi:MAG: zinc-binding dehydrogenase [Candidatus Heimdallarchaeota archaeon]|nr:zinc-binding dehydrogenase [Candidatus Heimdallarchaeota archaeon]
MRAVVLDKIGKPEVLKISEIEDPIIGDNQVLIRTKYAGVNFADLLARQGLYSWSPKRPYVLGFESSGIVEEIGKNVTSVEVGQSVIAAKQTGGYAELTAVDEKLALTYPSYFNYKEAAAYIATWGTAWLALEEMARVRKGERLLVQAAAGGVGTSAVLLGQALGLEVYGTASTQEKRDFIESLGATALTYDNFDKELEDKPPNCVLESIGGKIFKRSNVCMAPLGRIVIIGGSGIQLNKWNPLSWYKAWKSLPSTNIGKVIKYSKGFMGLHIGRLIPLIDQLRDSFDKLNSIVEENDFRPIVRDDQIFNLEQATIAHQFIHDRKNIGKVLLKTTK